ncbi:MAG: flagellar type III secretion system pore protein FliP [Nannocystaceae bacterium]|nr:flagellar type III secretion system pore protein FliP [Nannocystaceae bacterium]
MARGRIVSAAAFVAVALVVGLLPDVVWAAPTGVPEVVQTGEGPSSTIHLVVVFALASLAPAIILTGTCFTRFIIVFSFLKSGLGTQGAPPNQVLVGLALFMTAFVMAPVANEIYADAGEPYFAGEVSETEAIDLAAPAAKKFLLPRTRPEDLALFYEYARAERPETSADVPLRIAVPAYVLSELRTSFQMGLLVLLPFLVIDLVVATVLSSLGMVMLPPTLVSLPLKLLVFVMADGWHILVTSLLGGVGI